VFKKKLSADYIRSLHGEVLDCIRMGQLICKVVEVLVGLLATGISINNTGNAQPLSKIKKKAQT